MPDPPDPNRRVITQEDLAREALTRRKQQQELEKATAEKATAEDVATSPEDDAESHARWERRGARRPVARGRGIAPRRARARTA